MKALLQRVNRASVSVAGELVGEIGQGLVVFVGVATGDTERDAQYLAQKTVNLRIFPDETGRFNLSALDVKGELLVVSLPSWLIPGRVVALALLGRQHQSWLKYYLSSSSKRHELPD